MSILVPKVHQDGSQIGMHGREWSNVISNVTYTSSSFIDGANILSGTHGLEVDERLLVVSPYATADVQANLTGDIVPLRINNLLAATAEYSMGGQRITNLGSPTAEGDAAPKSYVDQAITGLKWKQSVKGSSVDKASPSTIYWQEFNQATWSGNTTAGFTRTSYGNPGWVYSDSGGIQKLTLQRPMLTRTNTGPYGLNVNTSNLVWNDDDTAPNITHSISEYLFDDVNTFKNGERVLVNVFQDASKNGIYEFETTGSSNETGFEYAKPVLVRTDDFNLTSEVSSAAVFIEEGTQNADTAFVCTTNNTDIEDALIGTYNIDWTVYGTQAVDNVTIYKDTTQSERLEVTGVLRDINDIYYNYSTGARLNVEDGQFLVGNGTTFVAEKDDVVRTSMGLGTGNSPEFTNLRLTGGELTASHFVSNTGTPTDPITLSSPLSGTVALTANSIALDTSVTSNTLTTAAGATIGATLAVNGQLSANGGIVVPNTETISGARSISAQFVTASVALSASYIQLKEFTDQTTFENANPTDNSLYVYGNALYFDGALIGGQGASQGQPKENALFYGGNIVSDKGTYHSPTEVFYMRMGVSGSHQDASTDATGRSLDFQILTGSFSELTGSKVDIDGGTIDNVVGNFTSLTATIADINGGTIDGTIIGDNSPAKGTFTTLSGSDVDIDAGTIDNTVIGATTPAAGTFNPLNSSNVNLTGGSIVDTSISGSTGDFSTLKADTADINGGTIDGTIIGATTRAIGKFTEITGSVEIDGGTISNTTIDNTNIINVNTGNFENGIFTDLTASNFIVPKDVPGAVGYVDINVSNTTKDSQIKATGGAKLHIVATDLTASDAHIKGGSLTGSFGVFTALTGSSAHIQGGSLTGSFGLFSVLTGSDVDINAGTIDGTEIGSSARSTGKFTELTGTHVVIENLLTASHNATIDFNDRLVQNVATVDLSAGQRKDAVNREYIDTVVGIKTKVRAAQTSNINKNTFDHANDDVDGVNIAAGDRILLTAQTDQKDNGIWQVEHPVGLSRPFDYLTDDNAGGFIVLVEEGTENQQSVFSLKSAGVIGTANIVATKISSQYGVSSAGKGISKNVNIFNVDLQEGNWDDDNYVNRANLLFNGSGLGDKLILSSSVRVDELKVVDSTGDGRVQISGSDDSYIDNVQIGMNTQAAAKFNNINLTDGTMVIEGTTKITGSAGATSKIELFEGRFDKLSVPGVMTAERTATPEHFVTIHESLKFAPATLANRSQRLYLNNGDLYFENHKIGSGGGSTTGATGVPTILSDFTSIYVTGSQADGHGAFISGSMIVEGDLQIRGTTTTVSSSNTTLQDSIIGLGITGSHSGNEEFNNLGDRGIIFARGANQTDALPGMWWDGLKFQFAKSVTSPSSGSFGAVTQRSTVKTGDVDALEVTASAGLNIGGNNGFNFPITDGNVDQVLTTDGSGYLSWADQSGGSSSNFIVAAATTTHLANISNGPYPGFGTVPGAYYLSVSGATLTIDGYQLNVGDKLLVKNGSNSPGSAVKLSHNGLYELESENPCLLRRLAGGYNIQTERGTSYYVANGSNNGSKIYMCKKTTVLGEIEQFYHVAEFIEIQENFLSAVGDVSLGGNLDVNQNDIVSTSNNDIEIAPDGTGSTIIKGNATGGSGHIVFNCEQNQHGVTIQGPANTSAATYTLILPPKDGTIDQIIKTDGFGNLQFVDMDHSFKLQRSNLTITTDPNSPSNTTQEFDMSGVDTDVFVMDFTGRNTTSAAYTSSALRWLTIRVKNLSSDFHRPGKNFYVGIRGFNHDNFQSSDATLLRLGFVFADAITGYNRDGTMYNSKGIKTTFIRGGNVYTSATPNTVTSSDEAARFQFSAGNEDANVHRPWSALLDRVDTDDSKIYCLKFSVTQGVGTTALEWRSNFDEIVTFDNDDPRLT